MYGLTLIITLALVGGLVAYFGDKIGMKVGRKRLTLFGLRPKHTGILITIVTGIFIAGSSIAVLSIASNDVRTALFRMKSIQEALMESQSKLEQTTVRIGDMEASLITMVAERDRAAVELEQAQAQMELAMNQYLALVEDLETAKQEVQKERQSADTFREASERLKGQVEDLESRRANLLQEYEVLGKAYESLAKDYDALDYVFANFENKMRYINLAYEADEIIFAQVFEGGEPIAVIYERLESFLEEANSVALRRGAFSDDNKLALILPQYTLDLAAHALHQQRGLWVVRAASESNTVVGEPIKTYLELIPNELIFLEGTVLAEMSLDLPTTFDLDKQLLTLLGEANIKAITSGMITQNQAAVEVPLIDFLATIDEANEISGRVIIRALAAEDTWAAVGPLKLKLEVASE